MNGPRAWFVRACVEQGKAPPEQLAKLVDDFRALLDMVSRERESGVQFSTLGFGAGNYNEQLLEQLADAGNGSYAYIDTLQDFPEELHLRLSHTWFQILPVSR